MRNGYTLIELIAVLAILIIASAIGIPSYQEFTATNRAAAVNNSLVTALQMARQTAVAEAVNVVTCQGNPIEGCGGAGRWNEGWFVFTDPNADRACLDTDSDANCDDGEGRILWQTGRVPSPFSVQPNGLPYFQGYVIFQSQGFTEGGYNKSFLLCEGVIVRGKLTLSNAGRLRQSEPDGNDVCDS